jgi:hypothetical protein
MESSPYQMESELKRTLDMLKIWLSGRFKFPQKAQLCSYLLCFILMMNFEPSSSITVVSSSLALIPKEKVVAVSIKKDDMSE